MQLRVPQLSRLSRDWAGLRNVHEHLSALSLVCLATWGPRKIRVRVMASLQMTESEEEDECGLKNIDVSDFARKSVGLASLHM